MAGRGSPCPCLTSVDPPDLQALADKDKKSMQAFNMRVNVTKYVTPISETLLHYRMAHGSKFLLRRAVKLRAVRGVALIQSRNNSGSNNLQCIWLNEAGPLHVAAPVHLQGVA